MNLKTQKRIAADIMKVGSNRVKFDEERLDDIKEAITKTDMRSLVKEGAVSKKPYLSQSKVRARKIKEQKKKGNRKGPGTKKGTKNARLRPKRIWVNKIRVLRKFLKELKVKNMIESKNYRNLILKSKGGFFRSKRHLKLYINEHKLLKGGDDE
ncbi:MAG: 50S ribosomal protein L19e [Nanoarchaeota archaeon]|nr:50S ribosomal protein L19e [Nanoarchaeota archaeon]|tara:strand:+ start:1165 stop:1626 length:462 start_codon:yes stop_codon:yes gene_type:complete